MAASGKDTSGNIPLHEHIGKKKIAIIAARWHRELIDTLVDGAKRTLLQAGLPEEHILLHYVPGSFELPQGAQVAIEYALADAVICIGVLIKGETPHFHYISESVTITISQISLRYNRPISFGVLTVDNLEQAQDRAGGRYGNKGEEAAQAALEMLSLKESLRKKPVKGKIGFSGITED